jgi:ribosomal protein S28E/S33
MGYSYGCYILYVYISGFNVRVSKYVIQLKPFLRCDPARNLVSTPFIQARILRIQRKLRKGKFSDEENKKQLRLTVSTSNFVSLMGYTGVVGTAADEVKVWVPKNVLPLEILRSPTLLSQVTTLKHKGSSDGEAMVMSKSASCERMTNRTTVGPSASGDVIEISSSEDELDPSAKGWLGFLDLTMPEPEQAQIQQNSGASEVVDLTMEAEGMGE